MIEGSLDLEQIEKHPSQNRFIISHKYDDNLGVLHKAIAAEGAKLGELLEETKHDINVDDKQIKIEQSSRGMKCFRIPKSLESKIRNKKQYMQVEVAHGTR